jgi:hypothetical protein
MIKWTSEIVQIATEDGEKVAMLHQNGAIEIYMLRHASKQDVSQLLDVESTEK